MLFLVILWHIIPVSTYLCHSNGSAVGHVYKPGTNVYVHDVTSPLVYQLPHTPRGDNMACKLVLNFG